MENLRELQRYSEKLQFEVTCVRLWANGIQDHADEQEKVQSWISGMTDEIQIAQNPASMDSAVAVSRESAASNVNGPSFQLAAANSIIQCRIYHSNEAGSGSKECVHGTRTEECTVPKCQGS